MDSSDLALERVYRWEKERPTSIYMTQPMGGGVVRDFTWADTLDESRRMAAHLKSLGFPPGSKIAILSKNCAHFIMSDLAIWMAGYVSVAMYPTLSEETIRYILDHSESKLLFVGKLDTWDQQKGAVPAALPCIAYPLAPKTDYRGWDDVVKKTEPIAGSPVRDADDTAVLVYTSGSTGTAKGVEHTFRSMAAAPKVIAKIFGLGTEDRYISYLPLAHVFERAAVEMMTLVTGARVFFAESLDTFVQDVQRARPTLFHSVPRLWLKFQLGVFSKMPEKKLRLLLKIPIVGGAVKKKVLTGLGLDQARYAVTGSAPVPPELIEWYRGLGLELLEGYAMSEDFVYSHLSLPGKAKPGYVGHVLEGAEAKISEEGEVLVKSPGNMKGYYKEPEMTAACYTADGFFKTGDRGEYDSEGRLRITGRVKELFKSSKGKYIAPAPIENLLNASSHVEMSCVTGSGLPQPFALVQLAEAIRADLKKGAADKAAIDAALAALLSQVNANVEEWEKLACLVVPNDEWLIENGFLTPTMKLKRSVIDDRYGPHFPRWAESKVKVVWHA
ncbi:MAG: AMP-binding protein [Deltaproteobacteria bacterium]|nr:AMP-binding protein [Deltaproteobacteria bacterium]